MSTVPATLQRILEPWLLILADDPVLRALQAGLLFLGVIVIFLVFYATRDILLRTRSFPAMLGSIVLVAFLPFIGFFLYLLVRPVRTLQERDRDQKLDVILSVLGKASKTRHQKPNISKTEKSEE